MLPNTFDLIDFLELAYHFLWFQFYILLCRPKNNSPAKSLRPEKIPVRLQSRRQKSLLWQNYPAAASRSESKGYRKTYGESAEGFGPFHSDPFHSIPFHSIPSIPSIPGQIFIPFLIPSIRKRLSGFRWCPGNRRTSLGANGSGPQRLDIVWELQCGDYMPAFADRIRAGLSFSISFIICLAGNRHFLFS